MRSLKFESFDWKLTGVGVNWDAESYHFWEKVKRGRDFGIALINYGLPKSLGKTGKKEIVKIINVTEEKWKEL